MNAADFWDVPEQAQTVVAEMKVVRAVVEPVTDVTGDIEALLELQRAIRTRSKDRRDQRGP